LGGVSGDNAIDTPFFPALLLLRKSLIRKNFTDTPCFFQKSAKGGYIWRYPLIVFWGRGRAF